jgi:hypothetical protein
MHSSQRLSPPETRLAIVRVGLERYFDRQARHIFLKVYFGVEVGVPSMQGPFSIFAVGYATVAQGMAGERDQLWRRPHFLKGDIDERPVSSPMVPNGFRCKDGFPGVPHAKGARRPVAEPALVHHRPERLGGVELQMYRHPPGAFSIAGNRDHVLTLHMGGKALIDDTTEGSRRQGWADVGCFSLTPAGTPVSRSCKGAQSSC